MFLGEEAEENFFAFVDYFLFYSSANLCTHTCASSALAYTRYPLLFLTFFLLGSVAKSHNERRKKNTHDVRVADRFLCFVYGRCP